MVSRNIAKNKFEYWLTRSKEELEVEISASIPLSQFPSKGMLKSEIYKQNVKEDMKNNCHKQAS